LKKNHHKKRTGGLAQGVGPEFKPQYSKKKKKKKKRVGREKLTLSKHSGVRPRVGSWGTAVNSSKQNRQNPGCPPEAYDLRAQ
jgi:hypothetical protein